MYIKYLLYYRKNLLDEIERCENTIHNNDEDVSTDMKMYLNSLIRELENVNDELARLECFPRE